MGKRSQDSFWNSKPLLLDRRHPFQLRYLTLLIALVVVLPALAISQTCQPDGDVNQDGSVTAADALLVFQQALQIADPPLSACEQNIADVYPVPTASDGNLTASDALCIFQKALSLVSCLDVMAGQPIAEPISFHVDPSVSEVGQQLIGRDPDGDTLTYEFLDEPSGVGYTNAAVDPQSGILSLTIVAGFTGEIRLHYRVTDGRLFSTPATIQITVEVITQEWGFGALPPDPRSYAALPASDAPPADLVLPPRVDLSDNFPPPGHQGRQNSCTAWATAYALKSYQEKREIGWALTDDSGEKIESRVFSPAFIYNQINNGEDRGSYPEDALKLIMDKGAATWDMMPYDQNDHRRQPTPDVLRAAANFKAKENGMETVRFRNGFKKSLYQGMPVVIAQRLCDSFDDLEGAGGQAVLTGDCSRCNEPGSYPCNCGLGGRSGCGPGSNCCNYHAMTLTGYDDNRAGGAFRVINSWGPDWGDGGYFWLTYPAADRDVFGAFILHDAENSTPSPRPDPRPDPPSDLPNLQVRSWNATYDPRPRGQGQLQYSVVNTGTGIAPRGADVNFVLSENPGITSTDYFVVWETIPFDLQPGDAVTRDQDNQLAFSFPDGLPEGTYYMAVWVDDFDVVEESNEDDNISLGDGRVTIENTLPDLYVRNWYAEWDGYGNGTLTYEVENIGRSSVHHGDWDINLVLSPDETIGRDEYGDSNETFLFYEPSTYALDPGTNVYRDDSNPAYFNLYQDAFGDSVPSGVYYMAVWVDDLEAVEESNELNNYSLGGNLIDISYASTPVAAVGGDRARSPVLAGADGASALLQQSPFVQPTRQVSNRLYNGHELPTHDALVKKVRIERTPQGDMSLTVSEAGDDEFPVHAQQRHSADVVIFPVVEEFFMPQNNLTNQGGK